MKKQQCLVLGHHDGCLCSDDVKINSHNHKHEIAYQKLKAIYPLIEGFCREAENEPIPPGGQQAGVDNCWAKRIPKSVLIELRRYAREFKVRLEDYTWDYYEFDREEEKKFEESLK